MAQTQIPNINEPSFFPFPDYHVLTLDNGIYVHILPFNNLNYTNFLFSVKSGAQVQSKLLQANLTNKMLREGCEGYSSESLAEELDFYGTALHSATSMLCSDSLMSTVNKHLPKMLPILKKIVFSPTFPKKEFEVCREISRQNLIHSMEEVGFMAKTQLKKMLYGDKHVYANMATPADYDTITIDDIRDFHSEFYLPNNVDIYVSGKFSDVDFLLLNELYGQMPVPRIRIPQPIEPDPVVCTEVRRFTPKNDCVQNAVAIGAVTIPQHHPDFLKLKFLICILGGYFGSRLMSNIREEKGYTYGIYAQLVSYTNFSTIIITSETASEYSDFLIEEVFKEIERLINEPVGIEELEMVKRYYTGLYLQQVSKGIDLISDYRAKVLNKIDAKDFYKQWWNVLHNTTPEELLTIAKTYLRLADFRVSVAGKC